MFDLQTYFVSPAAILAPMEEVSDAVFRAICRARGARLCVTEFVHAPSLLAGEVESSSKLDLSAEHGPTAVQIYGANASELAQAAARVERAEPAFIDINCGCWVPKVARGGAGAGWLRDPDAMVRMAQDVVRSVSLPVTVKTRIGYGPESHMPIVELARRLEDAGVSALTIHCRTAEMGHSGSANWEWARKAREGVSIPVVVNGDVRTAEDAHRALSSTGCQAVMIGRRAMEHPWVFREVEARLAHRPKVPAPTRREHLELCCDHLLAMREHRGERRAIRAMRRIYPRYLKRLVDARELCTELERAESVEAVLETLHEAEEPFEERLEA